MRTRRTAAHNPPPPTPAPARAPAHPNCRTNSLHRRHTCDITFDRLPREQSENNHNNQKSESASAVTDRPQTRPPASTRKTKINQRRDIRPATSDQRPPDPSRLLCPLCL